MGWIPRIARRVTCFGVTAGLGVSCTSEAPEPDAADVVGPYTGWTDGLTSALRTSGIPGATVEEGGFLYRTLDDCADLVRELGTCYGLHPASPYLMVDFHEPDDPVELLPTYQLAQDEALLYVGHTPPSARYFSFNHYQYLKHLPGEAPALTFGSMAPSLSMLDFSVDGTSPYDRYAVVITTANATTAARLDQSLRPLLAAHGVDAEVMVHPIGYADAEDARRLRDGEVVRGAGPLDAEHVFELTMGRGEEADWYTMAVRVAAADEPGHPYLSEQTIPAAAFRVRFDAPPGYDPFPFPQLPPPRDTAQHQGNLRAAMQIVADALEERLHAEGRSTERVEQRHRRQRTGPDCINQVVPSCAANNDDAHYVRTAVDLAIPDLTDPDSSVYVLGVLHRDVPGHGGDAAPPVSYSSLTLVNLRWFYGVVTLLDEQLEGSVRGFFPDGVPGLSPAYEDSLYLQQFARTGHCDPALPCVEIGHGPLGLAPDETFDFMERIYMNETTGTAPGPDSVEPGFVIVAGSNLHYDPTLGAYALNGPTP